MINASTWNPGAKWVWQSDYKAPVVGNIQPNTWLCFRKTFSISDVDAIPETIKVKIAVDSRYWLWINGNLVVRDGGLKRGPKPGATYYDELDIDKSKCDLVIGTNSMAILVCYWGKTRPGHADSGHGGLLFNADLGSSIRVTSDTTWKTKAHPSFKFVQPCSGPEHIGETVCPEDDIYYDATQDSYIGAWTELNYSTTGWNDAAVAGTGNPGDAPWGELVVRPFPQWKDGGLSAIPGLRNYDKLEFDGQPVTLPYKVGAGGAVILAYQPFNLQFYPYLKVTDSEGNKEILIQPNTIYNYGQELAYKTKADDALQEFEGYNYLNGDVVYYTIPQGITVNELKYRETGFDTMSAGVFSSTDNDGFWNILWEKAKRTLYLCMRDSYVDCPDREKQQWIGDTSTQICQNVYHFDSNVNLITKKALDTITDWRYKGDGFDILPTGVPFDPDILNLGPESFPELPAQDLMMIGEYGGLWTYYMNTGDTDTLAHIYPALKNYLNCWKMGHDGLVAHRGNCIWFDTFDHVDFAAGINREKGICLDKQLGENVLYYSALKTAEQIAEITGNSSDIGFYTDRIASIEKNFDKELWDPDLRVYRGKVNWIWMYDSSVVYESNPNAYPGITVYQDPNVEGPDDRAIAMAVLAGLVPADKYAYIRDFLVSPDSYHASPYMERYVDEALFKMGYPQDALNRIQTRYAEMVYNKDPKTGLLYGPDSPGTTLWEDWKRVFDAFGDGNTGPYSRNHAWAGGAAMLLPKYAAGISPTVPGYSTYQVLPDEGDLTNIYSVVPSPNGQISVSIDKTTPNQYKLILNSPESTSALIGIPRYRFGRNVQWIAVNGIVIWSEGVPVNTSGVTFNEDDGKYVKYFVNPGLSWVFSGNY